MQDKFSRLINVLKNKLSSKKSNADKKTYKRYPFYTIAFVAKLAAVLISSLASLGIIYWLRADIIATRQQNIIAGLCQPMTAWSSFTLNGLYLGITILIVGFSIASIKNATEE